MDIISITKPQNLKNLESIDNDDSDYSDISMNEENESGDEEQEQEEDDELYRLRQLSKMKNGKYKDVVTPGELITDDNTWMRGHGTYFLNEKTYSSVAGTVLRVNKLLSVIPFNGRYSPETGDHIVGRIVEVGNKRWKVNIGGEHDAVLMLGSVNLPGGILRRRSETDELQMRNFLKEGDLLNAEVQSIFQDGMAALHTRSLKYGKLRNGVFVSIPSNLIIRSKNHYHELPGNVSVILGVNGFIWISKTTKETKLQKSSNSIGNSILNKTIEAGIKNEVGSKNNSSSNNNTSINRLEEESSWNIYSDKNEDISTRIKDTISRYRNCILALAYCNIGINETRLVSAYEISLSYGEVNVLVTDEVKQSIGDELINMEKMRGNGNSAME